MTDAAFPAHISAALDRLSVPALPIGFAERLLARIEAGDLPTEGIGEMPPLPAPRRPIMGARRWLRPGRVIAGVALLGVTTATAAASGVFGEPVYVPVVSEVLAKADVVELPVKTPPPKAAKPAASPQNQKQAAIAGPDAVRQLYERLRSDPEFRALPPKERTAIARKELELLLRAGTIQPGDIRTVMAENKEERQAQEFRRFNEQLRKRQQVAERLERYRTANPDEKAAMREEQRVRNAKTKEKIRTAFETLTPTDQQRLLELREALRDAPPAERPAIRREIRVILRKMQKNSAPAEGNPDPAR